LWFALAAALAAVLAGAALALGGAGPRVIAALRAFALAAVIATVVGDLLPEAVRAGGAAVLVAFAIALAAPGVMAQLASRGGHDHGLATELAYVSLLLHKITDGVALGAALAPGQARHWDVIAAVAGHTLPMAATVALAYRDRPRVAWLRALGLAAAIAVGAALADLAAVTVLADATPWLGAIAAGLLLHVVTHDLPVGGRDRGDRALELVALAAGAAMPVAFGAGVPGFGAALLAIARAVAPAALLGLIAAATLQAWAGARATDRLRRHGGALAGVATAAALPGCACGGLPAAIEVRRGGASLAAAAALALAAPALGVDALLVTLVLFGAPLAALRLAAAIVLAMLASRALGRPPRTPSTPPRAVDPDEDLLHGDLVHRVGTAIDELITHAAPWLCAGLVVATLLAVSLAPGALVGLHPAGAFAIALALAIPARVSLVAVIAPAAVLIDAGVPAGVVIAALVIAPLAQPRTLRFLRHHGGRRVAIAVAAAIGVAVVAAMIAVQVPTRLIETPPMLGTLCLGALAVLAVRSLWRSGAGAWIGALHGHGQHGHTHDERHVAIVPAPAPHADHHTHHHDHAHDAHAHDAHTH